MLLMEFPVFFDIFEADKVPNLASPQSKKCRSGGTWSGLECPRNGGFNRHSFRHRPHSWLAANATGKPNCPKKQQGAHSPSVTPAATRSEPTQPTTTIVPVDRFTADFDLRPFGPNEINVRMDGNTLLVTGKREVQSEGEYELREYTNKVIVPENVVIELMKCALNETGHLLIEAPLKKPQEATESGRIIPIEFIQKPYSQDVALD